MNTEMIIRNIQILSFVYMSFVYNSKNNMKILSNKKTMIINTYVHVMNKEPTETTTIKSIMDNNNHQHQIWIYTERKQLKKIKMRSCN